MKFSFVVVILIVFMPFGVLKAQTEVVQKATRIGEKCPDFTLANIVNYSSSTISIADFKGKLLILDFWATWCMPCIQGLPKLDSLQKEFKNKIQIIGVSQESKSTITDFFEKRKKALKGILNFPTTTDDSLLSAYFKHIYLPHYVWIDQEGYVIAITDESMLNNFNIDACLNGKKILLPNKIDRKLADFNYDQPLFLNGNGTSDNLLLHSVLTKYIPGVSGMDRIYDKRIMVLNYPKLYLYMLAYGGNKDSLGFSPSVGFPKNRVILNIRDTVLNFESPKRGVDSLKEWEKRNSYCYDVILPGYAAKPRYDSAQQNDLYMKMQKDLENAFPIKARIEKRRIKCLVLICKTCDDKIKSKGGKPEYSVTAYSLHIRNNTLDNFMYQLRYISFQMDSRPFVDEVQYRSKVDIDINATLADPVALNAELKKCGLELIEAEREIDMLVLSDT